MQPFYHKISWISSLCKQDDTFDPAVLFQLITSILKSKHISSTCSVTFLNSNYLQTLEEGVKTLPLSTPCSLHNPPLFITLTAKAKYEHIYEYMNSWSSGDCYSLACCSCRVFRVFCRGGCSKCWAWAFWQDVWSGAEGCTEAQVLPSSFLLRKNDLCAPVPLCLSMLPVPSFFSRSHAGIKCCHLHRW